MIIGFKCYNKGLVLEEGKEYTSESNSKFGTEGFHFYANIEDSFISFDCFNDEVDVYLVAGSKIIEVHNDMYYSQNITIIKKLTREEVISIALNLNEIRVKRFISTFGLTKDEIELFKDVFLYSKSVLDTIEYYQEEDRDVYKRTLDK